METLLQVFFHVLFSEKASTKKITKGVSEIAKNIKALRYFTYFKVQWVMPDYFLNLMKFWKGGCKLKRKKEAQFITPLCPM